MSFYQAGDYPQRPCTCGHAFMSICPPPPCVMHGNPAKFTFGTISGDQRHATTPAPTVGDLERRIAELERRLADRLDDEPVKAGGTD